MIRLVLFIVALVILLRSDAAAAAFLTGSIVFFGIAIVTMLIGLPAGFAVVLGGVGVIVLVCSAINHLGTSDSDASKNKLIDCEK